MSEQLVRYEQFEYIDKNIKQIQKDLEAKRA